MKQPLIVKNTADTSTFFDHFSSFFVWSIWNRNGGGVSYENNSMGEWERHRVHLWWSKKFWFPPPNLKTFVGFNPYCNLLVHMQIRLLSMLDEYKILRHEKEEERKRQRVLYQSFLSVYWFHVMQHLSSQRDFFFYVLGPEKTSGTTDSRTGSLVWVKTKPNEATKW